MMPPEIAKVIYSAINAYAAASKEIRSKEFYREFYSNADNRRYFLRIETKYSPLFDTEYLAITLHANYFMMAHVDREEIFRSVNAQEAVAQLSKWISLGNSVQSGYGEW